MQMLEREAVDTHTKLLAFDRQNHMGASHQAAGHISDAIRAEAEAQLAEKRVVTNEVNIKENVHKIKVGLIMRDQVFLALSNAPGKLLQAAFLSY